MRTIIGKMDGRSIVMWDEKYWQPFTGVPEIDDIVRHKNRVFVYVGYDTYRNITEQYLIATGNVPITTIVEGDLL